MSAAGYTTVYLVVNMNQFIHAENQKEFENVRGTQPLAQVIKNEWDKLLMQPDSPFARQEQFVTSDGDEYAEETRMNVDEVAFATGIFKGVVLRNYSSPFYKIDKDKFFFSQLLRENFQFKTLFLENWDRWEIHIRPTMTGMFIIRLTDYYDHEYGTQSAEFRTIASNVQSLQSSFDVPSAIDLKESLLVEINKGADEAIDKLETIECLLEWLGVDGSFTKSMDYPRVQWQLAQEVCNQFVESIGPSIILPNQENISLTKPKRNITSSLNDSFVVYHFNELHAPGRLIYREHWSKEQWKKNQDQVFTLKYRDLEESPKIKESISQLIEGAMLKRPAGPSSEFQHKDSRRFPRQNPAAVNKIFENNFSTWDDELCLMSSRCCVIWPSRNARNDYLYISTLPTTTSRVKYLWYWDAMERMVEFIIEIKLLSNLVELKSVEALNRFSKTLNEMRLDLLGRRSDSKRQELATLANDVTNLSRLVGLSRRLSTPQTWSRAEYATGKASYFMEQLSIPQLINHAETNVDNMTSLINHQDELYLANLSEESSQRSLKLSIGFFVVSIILLVYSMPSFWVDTVGLYKDHVDEIDLAPNLIYFIYWSGNLIAILVLFVGLIGASVWAYNRFWKKEKSSLGVQILR